MSEKLVLKYSGLPSKTKVLLGLGRSIDFLEKNKEARLILDRAVYKAFPGMFPTDHLFLIEGGEEAKSFRTLELILDFLAQSGTRKDDLLIAAGGGTVSDVAGLAASLYMRGLDLALIPTTLLAMTDASIGGKFAINVNGVKNLAGIIKQPRYIVADTLFLEALSQEDFLSGMGEVLKHALLSDGKFFKMVTKMKEAILAREVAVLEKLVLESIEIKAQYVTKDEEEKELRSLLNLGHTVAHAIEGDSVSYSHGEAVITGIYLESLVGVALGVTKPSLPAELAKLFHAYGFPLSYKPKDENTFFNAITLDKKQRKEFIKLPLLIKPGKVSLVRISAAEFTDSLREVMSHELPV